jgi:hypothetical protein
MYCIFCGEEGATDGVCDECSIEKSVEQLITHYFHYGYPYDAIVGLLNKKDIHMSVRTLKRRLRSLGLRRKGNTTVIDNETIRTAIQKEMEGAGKLSGYRSIWHALRLRHHIHVPRNLVAEIMKEIDPVGVEERRARRLKRRTFTSKGANATWHMDGKLYSRY